MFLTVHTAVAIIVGKSVMSAPWAFILGLASHFILDLIPHGDSQLASKFFKPLKFGVSKRFLMVGIMDLFLLILFILFLSYNSTVIGYNYVIWAIIGGILPDIIMVVYSMTKFKPLKWFYNLHDKNHGLITGRFIKDYPIKYGLVVQTILLIIFTYIILQ